MKRLNIFFINIIASFLVMSTLQGEVFLTPFEGFTGQDLHVVAAFIKTDDHVLFMKVAPHKRHGNQWAIPGGKVNKGESLDVAICREIQEETSLVLDFKFIQTVYIRNKYSDFTYHMYEAAVPYVIHDIPLTNEHTDLAWWTLEEALEQDLMSDESECIRIAYPRLD